MATLQAISDALQLIDSKRDNLKKAFDDLQGHAHLLSSFSITWSDLESHFTSIQNSLSLRFFALESLEAQVSHNQPDENEPCSSLDGKTENQSEPDGMAAPVSLRPELKRLCEQMDGKGLKSYVIDQPKERGSVKNELPAALKFAPDQETLVLDAMEGLYVPNSNAKGDNVKLSNERRSCTLLLEALMDNCPNVGNHVMERAKKLAMEWKQFISKDGEEPLDTLAFLHLVAAYGLTSEFETGDLVDCFFIVAHHRQATKLCRVAGLGDRVPDIVQKLLNKGKHIQAVKFIFEFELNDKFPPVPILKDYVKESKKAANTVSKEGKNSLKSLNEATAKEMGALKSVVRSIELYKLDSVYPRENLEKRIEQLEKQQANRKRPAAPGAPVFSKQKQPQLAQQVKHRTKKQKPQLKKRTPHQFPINLPPMAVRVGANIIAGGNPTFPIFQQTQLPGLAAPYQQSHVQSAGLFPNNHVSYAQSHLPPAGMLPNHPAPYESSSAVAYGMAGSTPAVAPYHGSLAEYPGFAGGPVGTPAGNAATANPNVYSSETYAPSGYYDGSSGYSGYGAGVPPLYHPSYYPQ